MAVGDLPFVVLTGEDSLTTRIGVGAVGICHVRARILPLGEHGSPESRCRLQQRVRVPTGGPPKSNRPKETGSSFTSKCRATTRAIQWP